jgi:hypothetical protein
MFIARKLAFSCSVERGPRFSVANCNTNWPLDSAGHIRLIREARCEDIGQNTNKKLTKVSTYITP